MRHDQTIDAQVAFTTAIEEGHPRLYTIVMPSVLRDAAFKWGQVRAMKLVEEEAQNDWLTSEASPRPSLRIVPSSRRPPRSSRTDGRGVLGSSSRLRQ